MTAYVDTSALVKLYLDEPGSPEFDDWLASHRPATISSLTVTELESVLARHRRVAFAR